MCQTVVEAVLVHRDTDTMLVDEAICPDPESKHGELTTLIGQAATERTDRKELAASVTVEIDAVVWEEGALPRFLPRVVTSPG